MMWWTIISTWLYSVFIIANGSSLEDVIDGKFDTVQVKNLSLFSVTAEELVHVKTGAKLLFLFPEYNTSEKAFAVSFTTPVNDETGVTHILEHSVLSGSRKYPVRFPLNHFSRESMATFVNAMTYPDRTTYPVATINTMDLYNLASVYLDAVFDPLALTDEAAFKREGWHLEVENAESPLTFSGIVFNEMKGVYSDPSQLRYKHLMHHLLANSSYEWSSGGYPPNIPDLTYQQFRDYYLRHYHPSNAQIYYFGAPDSMSDLLNLIDSYLNMAADRYTALELPLRPVLIQEPNLDQEPISIKFVDVPVPHDESSPKNSVVLAKVIGTTTDLTVSQKLALDLLSHLLVGKRETPLYKAIEDATLGSRVINYGVFDHGKMLLFLVGVSGVDPCTPVAPLNNDVVPALADTVPALADIAVPTPEQLGQNKSAPPTVLNVQNIPVCADVKQLLKQVVDEQLQALAVTGFDKATVEATLNRFEFGIRESAANAANQGLAFLNIVYDSWNYQKDPVEGFDLDVALEEIKQEALYNETFFPDLIKKYLLSVKRTVVLQAVADATMEESRSLEEQGRLERIRNSMTDEQVEQLVVETEEARRKKAEKDSPEAIATLPRLPLSVLNPNSTHLPIAVSKFKDIFLITHELPTAGIAYVDLYIDLKDLTKDQLFLSAGLIPHLLLHGDTKSRSAKELDSLLEFATGDVSLSLDINNHHRPGHVGSRTEASAFWELSWKCLDQHLKICFEAVRDIIFDVDFGRNQNRTIRWLEEILSRKEARALSSPSSYARRKFNSYLSLAGAVTEYTSGLTSINETRTLLQRAKSDWNALAADATAIWNNALRPSRFVLNAASNSPTLRDAVQLAQSIVLTPLLNRDQTQTTLETEQIGQTEQPDRTEQTGQTSQSEGQIETESQLSSEAGTADHSSTASGPRAQAQVARPLSDTLSNASTAASYNSSGFIYSRPLWADQIHFHPPTTDISELYVVPSMVAYNYLGGTIYEAESPIYYKHLIPSQILSIDYVFPKIRFVGAAYGASFGLSLSDGKYTFSSYRDPEIGATYDAMRGAPDAMDLIASSVTQGEINQFIIRALADMDEPLSNGAKSQMSFIHWLKGTTQARLDYIRSQILGVTPDDFMDFADSLRSAMTDGRPQIAITFAKGPKMGSSSSSTSSSSSMTIFNAVN